MIYCNQQQIINRKSIENLYRIFIIISFRWIRERKQRLPSLQTASLQEILRRICAVVSPRSNANIMKFQKKLEANKTKRELLVQWYEERKSTSETAKLLKRNISTIYYILGKKVILNDQRSQRKKAERAIICEIQRYENNTE